MKAFRLLIATTLAVYAGQVACLSLGVEEFEASRKMACVLAEQTLGRLTEDEYGRKTHTLLDGFDDAERDNILAQALGYYGGLTFSSSQKIENNRVNIKLEEFVASSTCSAGYQTVTHTL